jgi:2-polyprenyl-3-methyl-5-hydroxy-6-metoxy-1,4-benzoquinol methylase
MSEKSTSQHSYDSLAKSYQDYSLKRKEYLDSINSKVIDLLSSIDNMEKEIKVLDVGAGDGQRAKNIYGFLRSKNNISFDLVENSDEMRKLCKKNFKPAKYNDIVQTNLPLGKYDMVIMLWNVISHITSPKDRQKAILNIYQSLKSGGIFFIDINHTYNIDQYGVLNFINHLVKDISFQKKPNIEFIVKTNSGEKIEMETYAFSPFEIQNLVKSIGFTVENIEFINYNNGAPAHWYNGQMNLTLKKIC